MNKKIITAALTVCALALLSAGCSKEELVLKQDSYTIEYGENVSFKVEDYFTNDKKVLENVKLESEIENEKDKTYPDIGEYTLSFIRDNDQEDKKEVKIIVKDTTAPKIEGLAEEYKVEEGQTITEDMFRENVTDLDEVTITVDSANVDYEKAGTYTAQVKAKDVSGNESTKEITVIVPEKEPEEVEEPQQEETSSSSNQSSNSQQSQQSSSSGQSQSAEKPKENNNTGSASSSEQSKPVESEDEKDDDVISIEIEEPTAPPSYSDYDIGNSGKLFDTEEEAIAWAESYVLDNIEEIYGYLFYSTYDKYTVSFKYRENYQEDYENITGQK